MLQGSVVYGQKLAEAVVLLIIVDRLAGCRCRVLENAARREKVIRFEFAEHVWRLECYRKNESYMYKYSRMWK